jgi:hypothetical protein
MRFTAPFQVRAFRIAALTVAVAIAVLGNHVLSGYGPGARDPKTAEPSECEKADCELLGEESVGVPLDMFAEEMINSFTPGEGQDEIDGILAGLLAETQAPSEETCPCADAGDDASAGCACRDRSDETRWGILRADASGISF